MDRNIHIRDMESRDYMSVAAVWRDVFGPLPLADESVVSTCEKMKADSRYRVFVADIDGAVVGLVATVESLAINLPNGFIKVNGLGVLPQFQHRGIGRMLMERVEKLAGERNISVVEPGSGFQRTEAHTFYEHLGYRKNAFRFSKRI